MIDESLDIQCREGGLKVSLSSFDSNILPTEILNSLGDSELIEISVFIKGEHTKIEAFKIFEISKFIRQFLETHKNHILYYYCDEITPIPNAKHNKSTLHPADYRNQLFTKLTEREICHSQKYVFMDKPLSIAEEATHAHIHLLFEQSQQEKASIVEDYLRKLSQEMSDQDLK